MFGTDKSLDGLYQAHGGEYKYYIEFREYMMKYQHLFSKKTSWALHRDVYAHKDHKKNFYDKGGDIYNLRFGMTRASGYRLSVRIKLLIKLLKTEILTNEKLISDEELLFVQYRWLLEGDTGLLCFKAINRYRGQEFNMDKFVGINDEVDRWIETIKKVLKKKLHPKKAPAKSGMTLLVYRRLKVQELLNPSKLETMFFPTIKEELSIREEWENDVVKKENIKVLIDRDKLTVPRIDTLFGDNQIDRAKLPLGLYELILENEEKECQEA
jgi:hypothetical protein